MCSSICYKYCFDQYGSLFCSLVPISIRSFRPKLEILLGHNGYNDGMGYLQLIRYTECFISEKLSLWYYSHSCCLRYHSACFLLSYLSNNTKPSSSTFAMDRTNQQDLSRRRSKHHRTAKTFAIMLGVLLLCYLPALIVAIIRTVVGDSTSSIYIGDAWGDTFAFFNSSVNLLIYCYRITEIRQAMPNTVCREIRKRQRNSYK